MQLRSLGCRKISTASLRARIPSLCVSEARLPTPSAPLGEQPLHHSPGAAGPRVQGKHVLEILFTGLGIGQICRVADGGRPHCRHKFRAEHCLGLDANVLFVRAEGVDNALVEGLLCLIAAWGVVPHLLDLCVGHSFEVVAISWSSKHRLALADHCSVPLAYGVRIVMQIWLPHLCTLRSQRRVGICIDGAIAREARDDDLPLTRRQVHPTSAADAVAGHSNAAIG
mmetsp:Transcript_64529/g.154126  ORF Transcript_64529/g.154126 Transcript_64529/m.154126 type:complete len:226 (+) Transcript_64529:77-754(+)